MKNLDILIKDLCCMPTKSADNAEIGTTVTFTVDRPLGSYHPELYYPSDTFTKQQWQDKEALHRFQLISPLLQTGLDDAKRLQLRRTIADENNLSVRTLYRYEKAFVEKQFAGLRPADREKRRSQIFPENFEFLLEQAIQLRREVPERSVAQIIYILEAEGCCDK